MLRFLPLVITAFCVQVAPSIHAQQSPTEPGTIQRRYADGTVAHYLMTGNNDGWQYTIRATNTVKRDANGRYYEEIGWSDLTSNAQQTLTPASLALRQTVSLDDPASYMRMPNLANVQPLLIGPITDTLTFYSDLLLALKAKLVQPGQTSYVSGDLDEVIWLGRFWFLHPLRGLLNVQPFRYPSAWQAATQFGYHPPALTLSATKPIAGFGYSEGGFPRGRIVGPYASTNLEGVGLVYSAVPAASAAECEARAASLSDSPEHSRVMLGQRSFSVYKTFSGGMSQSMSGELYATYASSICYLFETNVAIVSPGVVDDIQTLTAAQLHDIETHLLEIMKSVRIAPSIRKQV